ncbi:hypothetical protein FOCC_FOCC015085, partial [Frankliniella occidentalis]
IAVGNQKINFHERSFPNTPSKGNQCDNTESRAAKSCLKEWFFVVDVPKDPRTILKTPRPNVKPLHLEGQALFNDGMEMAKSMPGSAWPILGIIPESLDDTPFIIGVFYDRKKFTVHNIEDYLGDLVKDPHELLVTGVYLAQLCVIDQQQELLSALLTSALNLDVINVTRGIWIRKRRTYLSSNFTLRTDESLRLQENKDHHTGDCPLVALPINMVDCFVVDYMHQCCLGTQKRLLLFYFGKAAKKSRIQYGKKCPRDFQRRPRSLMHNKEFKATEFRQLMLKYGMVDNFSTFPFENYLRKLRRSVRAYHHPLQQLVNRYQENNLNTNKAQREMTLLCPHDDGPVVSGIRGSQFKRLQSKTL